MNYLIGIIFALIALLFGVGVAYCMLEAVVGSIGYFLVGLALIPGFILSILIALMGFKAGKEY